MNEFALHSIPLNGSLELISIQSLFTPNAKTSRIRNKALQPIVRRSCMSGARRHIHLDPLGGISGDMFLAALLDAFPELVDSCARCIHSLLGGEARVELEHGRYSGLAGARFQVRRLQATQRGHRSWSAIRAELEKGRLDEAVAQRAVAIFQILADAEATVHGTRADEVCFHEIGAVDSIADVVGAAFVIESLGATGWSVGALPLGRGRVETAHGIMPVPAPATTVLLEGFPVHDDGIEGERVTPTGAAILRYLQPDMEALAPAGKLLTSGMGFGSGVLPGQPNLLRALVLSVPDVSLPRERVGVIRFEIDDQTGEDLAVALERLRSSPGVIDVYQMPVFGKKGRMMASVQVLVRAHVIEDAISVVFAQTTTLGLRASIESRRTVMRREHLSGDGVRVKIAERPGQVTAKADMDDVAVDGADHADRQRIRGIAEADALAQRNRHDDE